MQEPEPLESFARNLWGLSWRFLLPLALLAGLVATAVTRHNTAVAERLREAMRAEAVERSRIEQEQVVANEQAAAAAQEKVDAAANAHAAQEAKMRIETTHQEAENRAQEERLLRVCVRIEPATVETVVLVTLDAAGLPQWSVGERLADCLSAIGLKADPHVLTETFYRSKHASTLSTGEVAGTLLSLQLTGKIRGVVIARISSKQSTPDQYGFVTTDVTLHLAAYNGYGTRVGNTELKASGAAIHPNESLANAVERLYHPNDVGSKLLSLNL